MGFISIYHLSLQGGAVDIYKKLYTFDKYVLTSLYICIHLWYHHHYQSRNIHPPLNFLEFFFLLCFVIKTLKIQSLDTFLKYIITISLTACTREFFPTWDCSPHFPSSCWYEWVTFMWISDSFLGNACLMIYWCRDKNGKPLYLKLRQLHWAISALECPVGL